MSQAARRVPRRCSRGSSASRRRSRPASRRPTRSAESHPNAAKNAAHSSRNGFVPSLRSGDVELTYDSVPGLVETRESFGETTLVVDPARLVEACTYLRDAEGFNMLADLTPADYLDWGKRGVAGYIGTAGGRDLNAPGSQGYDRLPDPKPKRFAMNYHLVAIPEAKRVRVQVWLDEEEPVPSVVPVWPTADWHEREAWDMMGIRIEGHPNLTRILMEDDWEGHPLRKDYPIGGEPVRFSSAE